MNGFERNATAAERRLLAHIHRMEWIEGTFRHLLDWTGEVAERKSGGRHSEELPPRSISHWGMFHDAA